MTDAPHVGAIVDRAFHYRDRVYRATGSFPEQFLVTADEDRCLRRCLNRGILHHLDTAREIRLYGMRVVIWDLSTGAAPVPFSAEGMAVSELRDDSEMLERIMTNMAGTDTEALAHSLPPLDDLDEGLQHCGRQFETFAAFMAHIRSHG